jgi:hypothetical protein
LSYADDLKHPLWQQRRLRVLEHAGWACECCGDTESQLHAHHKVYLKGHKPWEYEDGQLECLCDGCHSRAHALLKQLEMAVAEHPTSTLPALARLVGKLGDALSAEHPIQRVDARNALQDELDALEDFRRGSGMDERAAA